MRHSAGECISLLVGLLIRSGLIRNRGVLTEASRLRVWGLRFLHLDQQFAQDSFNVKGSDYWPDQLNDRKDKCG